MSVLPSATFAGAGQPFFVDGNLPVTILSGELNVESRGNDGSYISLSPTWFHPPRTQIPAYNFTAHPDNTLSFGRIATPDTYYSNSFIMNVIPGRDDTLENEISLNGQVAITNSLYVTDAVYGLAGLSCDVHQLPSSGDPTPDPIPYIGVTIYLEAYAGGNGEINIQPLPDFFQSASTQYLGNVMFRLVNTNGSTQTVNILDTNDNIIMTVSVSAPSILEAVRLSTTIATHTIPIVANTSTPLVLTGPAPVSTKRKVYLPARTTLPP